MKLNIFKNYASRLKTEFSGYNAKSFSKDVLAGITVAAVALPLALAFGVSSGATAAAGLVTAIIAGIIIGALSGGSYQISGPTGAMTAILLSLVAKYQLQGVFIASLISGILLLIRNIVPIRTVPAQIRIYFFIYFRNDGKITQHNENATYGSTRYGLHNIANP